MNRFRPVDLLFAICAASLVIACGDSNGPTPQTPAAPDGLIATASSPTEIDIAWTDNASNEDGYRIELAPGGTTTFTEIAIVAAGMTGFQHTSLSAGTAYSYRVRAYNAGGPSDYSNTATATTHVAVTVPAAPSALAATAVSTAQIDLTWRDNASNEEGFRIEQALAGTMTFTEIATVAANTTGFQHTGLSAETANSYRLRAYNADGPSRYSNIAIATTATTPADVDDLQGTWTLEPRLGFDCGFDALGLDTVRTVMTAPGVMTFTMKGRRSHFGEVVEASGEVALGAGNTFAVSGTKTYSYANLTFTLDGQFIGSNSFSTTVWIAATVHVGTRDLGCEQGYRTGVIGNRTMSLLPTSLTITRGASGVFTVAIPADQSTPAEVTLSIAPQIGIVPASVTIQPGENSASFTVTGTDPGTAIITASLNGLSARSTLVVSP